jgi:hypothetical protein
MMGGEKEGATNEKNKMDDGIADVFVSYGGDGSAILGCR